MKILVSNEIYGIKSRKSEKKIHAMILQASDIKKNMRKKQ